MLWGSGALFPTSALRPLGSLSPSPPCSPSLRAPVGKMLSLLHISEHHQYEVIMYWVLLNIWGDKVTVRNIKAKCSISLLPSSNKEVKKKKKKINPSQSCPHEATQSLPCFSVSFPFSQRQPFSDPFRVYLSRL